MLVSALIGAGIGLAYGSMPALVMAAAPISETAAANSVNTLMRAIGTSVAAAVAGVLLTQLTSSFGPLTVASHGAFQLIMAIAAVACLLAPGDRGVPAGPRGGRGGEGSQGLRRRRVGRILISSRAGAATWSNCVRLE